MGLMKVNRRGQVALPKKVRDALRISEGDYVLITQDGDKAVLTPIRRTKLADLRGSLPATRPYLGMDAVRREAANRLGKAASE